MLHVLHEIRLVSVFPPTRRWLSITATHTQIWESVVVRVKCRVWEDTVGGQILLWELMGYRAQTFCVCVHQFWFDHFCWTGFRLWMCICLRSTHNNGKCGNCWWMWIFLALKNWWLWWSNTDVIVIETLFQEWFWSFGSSSSCKNNADKKLQLMQKLVQPKCF